MLTASKSADAACAIRHRHHRRWRQRLRHRPRRGRTRLSVFLCEMGDLASGTSSAATKLIHGGLRYLEYYEFRLVREALAEREVLWAIAPHIIWPLRFVLPHHKGLRPAWLLRLGLFLYDHLGGAQAAAADRDARPDARDAAGQPLKPRLHARLRIFRLLGRRCAAGGAQRARRRRPRRHHRDAHQGAVGARGEDGLWTIELQDRDSERGDGDRRELLVNAAGPWVDEVLARRSGSNDARHVRLVKGSHIVVREALRPRPLLYLPERRRAHHLRHPLRARLHADRHHRPRLSRRSRRGVDDLARTRSTICCAAASEYFAKPVTPERRRLDLFRRAAAVRRRRQRGAGGDARLCARSSTATPSGAAAQRLRRQAHDPSPARRRRCWSGSSRAARRQGQAAGPRARKLPGGDFPATASTRRSRRLARSQPWLDLAQAAAPARPRLRHAAPDVARRARGGSTIWARFRRRL